MNIFEIILGLVGVYLILTSILIPVVDELIPKVFLNVIPFLIGCYCIFFSLMSSQIITINL